MAGRSTRGFRRARPGSFFALTFFALAATTSLHADPLHEVEIDTASGPHRFSVELARSAAEREHGLMDRRSMPRDHGMLFQFESEQPLVFWMKDTYIPLDMIFVDKKGRVVSIKHDAKPMDETLIPSGPPALGVVELNAGIAESIGLKVGDRVKNPIFDATTPKG